MEFVDTNVLIYAHDKTAGGKQAMARDLVRRLTITRGGALSIQVLSEFYSATTGKGILSDSEAVGFIHDFSRWTVHCPAVAHLIEGVELRARHRMSWWDALILNSALQLGCTTLWTEDFSHGQQFGSLIVRNPFKA